MHFPNLLLEFSGAAWVPLADAIAKATLLFGAAGVISALLRRASAATRHMVWTLALLSALVLPVLSLALPRWQLPIVTLSPIPVSAPAALTAMDTAATDRATQPLTDGFGTAAGSGSLSTSRVNASIPPARGGTGISETLDRLSWPVLLLALWAAGAAVILARLAAGHLAVMWMSRRTERVNEAPWLPLARALAATLGISPRIMFLRSRHAAMPMAWGVVLPTVLMPADADGWPAERLRIVLLHELAHVKRRDCLTHLLAQLACALYWFNPLAWIAARHVRTERERACDDLVLATGTRGSDYADQLLEVARVMRVGRFPALMAGASLAMAHRSQLEGRLIAILDPNVPRSGPGRVRTLAAASIFAGALMPLASIQPWTYAASEATEVPAARAQTETAPSVPSPATRPGGRTPGEPDAQAAAGPAMQSADPRGEDVARGRVRGGRVEAQPVFTAPDIALSSDPNVNANIQSNIASDIQSNIASDIQSNLSANRYGGVGSQDVVQDPKGKTADPRMVAALTAALKDTDKDVRETALHALVRLRDPGVFAPLVQALTDASPEMRQQAAAGLGQMRDRRAVEPLVAALKDQNAEVRQQAVFALGQLRDRAAVPGLASVLRDTDDDVREQAVFALGQIRDPAAYDGLATAVRDPKEDVREQAVFALGRLRDRRAVEPLISALKDSTPDVRGQAAFALGQIRDARAVEALVIALKDSVADVRQQAAFALGQIGDARAIDGLTTALKDSNAEVRQRAAFALGQLIK
jgi:HEAT repeat protein/beta-lactamase regulating signal transducer with metallopeptidase domain